MNIGCRRVQSEVLFRFSDENSLFFDMEGEDNNHHHHHDLLATYMDMEKIMCADNNNNNNHDHSNNNIGNDRNDCVNYVDFMDRNNKLKHSFSVDGFSGFSSSNNDNNNNNDSSNINVNNNGHRNSNVRKNRDGEAKKAMSPDKLAELWIADPKRAKRILANRQSAARSKERKARYMVELEKKVQALQTEATALSAQLSLFERDTTGLSSENTDLRRQLESMEQQAQLRDALNDALQQELDRLKVATGETTTSVDSFIIPSLQNIPSTNSQQQATQPEINPNSQHSKLLPLYPYENTIPNSNNLDSHISNISPFHSFDYNLHNSYHPVEPNVLTFPHQQPPKVLHQPDTNPYLPLETYKQTMQQFCPSQNNVSPLGHLPQFPLELNSDSPSAISSQDHLSRFQGLDLSGRGPQLISSENMGF